MTIKEEIKILENALSGALLVPSECTFVNTEVIKICLDTLKTYESWENLIRYEIEKQIKAEAIDEFIDKLPFSFDGRISESTVRQIAEQLKEQNK